MSRTVGLLEVEDRFRQIASLQRPVSQLAPRPTGVTAGAAVCCSSLAGTVVCLVCVALDSSFSPALRFRRRRSLRSASQRRSLSVWLAGLGWTALPQPRSERCPLAGADEPSSPFVRLVRRALWPLACDFGRPCERTSRVPPPLLGLRNGLHAVHSDPCPRKEEEGMEEA